MRTRLLLVGLAVALALPAEARPPRRCDTAHAHVGARPVPTAPGLHDPVLDGALTGDLPELQQARLQAVLHRAAHHTPILGLQAAVGIPGVGRWSTAVGTDTLAGRPVQPEDRFHVASVGKLLTATLAWQLAEQGALDLDAPIATWLPDIPNGQAATVRHLLSHRSGHGNFNADRRFHRSTDPLALDALLARTAKARPLYCPGATASYSNTGFAMLGAIVEQVGGASLAALARQAVFVPLHMDHSEVLPWDATDGPTVAGHRDGEPVGPQPWGRPHGAGPMVSTASDLITLLHGLVAERLVTHDTVVAMASPQHPLGGMPGLTAGQGLLQLAPEGVSVVGHPGGITGFSAIVLVSPTHRAYVAVVANDEQTNVAAIAWQLLEAAGRAN